MELLRRIWSQIAAHFRVLSLSQRLLIAALVVLIAVCLYWLVSYSGRREMQPLLKISLTEQQVGRITRRLQGWNVPFEVRGDRIMVPATRRSELLAMLSFEGDLPEEAGMSYADLLKNDSLWKTEKQRMLEYQAIKQAEIARRIRRFRGVRNAWVDLEFGTKRTIGGQRLKPSATVWLEMEPSATVDKDFVLAVANGVKGSIGMGMRREDVKVVNATTGRYYPVPKEEDIMPVHFYELKKLFEDQYVTKIRQALGDMVGLLVAVDVTPQVTASETVQQVADREKTVSAIASSSSRSEQSASPTTPAEAGTVPNTGATINPAGASAAASTSETTDERFSVIPAFTTTRRKDPGGQPSEITASVRVPRSYFVNIVRSKSTDPNKPVDDAAVQKLISERLPKMQEAVMAAIGVTDAAKVSIGWYYDTALPAAAMRAGAAGKGTVALLTDYARPATLGLLAVVSMLSVLMMVRKASARLAPPPAATTPPATRSKPVRPLEVEENIVGQADESHGMLQGMELDEEAVRTQQILKEIQNMVRQNPETAASLVSHWIRSQGR